jgi:hypothetical protein
VTIRFLIQWLYLWLTSFHTKRVSQQILMDGLNIHSDI